MTIGMFSARPRVRIAEPISKATASSKRSKTSAASCR
jgi:hypothetical protein